MQNSFASESQYRIVYWMLWIVLGSIYAVLLIFLWEVNWVVALADSGVFTALFALMGIAVWYLVRFSEVDTARIVNTLVSHLVAGGILVFIVIAVGEALLPLIFEEYAEYYKFSSTYHVYRLVIGFLLYTLIAINFYLIVYYEEYRSRRLRESEMDKHLRSAELNMLKAQINPHFIFNSLNSVSSLTLTNPERAHEMVIQLADFLRYSIRKNADQLVTLDKEIEAIELFLAIEKTRFGDRLNVEIDCSDKKISTLRLPALILQPLVENAIKYSLHETDLESKIIINCSQSEEVLKISIQNNYDPEYPGRKGEGIGLKNVKSRLQLVYNRVDLLEIRSVGGDYIVDLTFPQS